MSKHEVAICIDNCGYEVSLETRKLYEVLPDVDAEKHGQIRVIDESGEDYIYIRLLLLLAYCYRKMSLSGSFQHTLNMLSDAIHGNIE